MKFSTYINNIIDAIFCPSFLIEERESNKKLQDSYEKLINAGKDYADEGWREAYKYAEQIDKISADLAKFKELKEKYDKVSKENIKLFRQIKRYYKPRKKL